MVSGNASSGLDLSHGFARWTPTDDWSRSLTTRSGFRLRVRPADAGDGAGLTTFFARLTLQDLRFRFLSGMAHVERDQIDRLACVDHARTETFLAFDGDHGTMVATAMIAADASMLTAEVAIAVHSAFKSRGIGWTLLEHVKRYARARGIVTLQSIEARENDEAIDLEREMGFIVSECPGDPTLVILRSTLA